MPERWEGVASSIEALLAGPTAEQLQLARAIGLELPDDVPAPVAAALLSDRMAAALMRPARRLEPNLEALELVEDELGVDPAPVDENASVDVVSAWIAVRYSEKTLRGLWSLQPVVGDVVVGAEAIGRRLISSVGSNGRVYLRGRPTRSAWPDNLERVSRAGDANYDAVVAEIDAMLRNGRRWFDGYTSARNFAPLAEFELRSNVSPPEAIRELEDLLESGERAEAPFQALIERYPQMLVSLVFGHHRAFVIPQQRLGAEHVTDFLVLGLNSHGPQWIAVELEGPRHSTVNSNGTLSTPARHAVQQIQDWREWLTANVAYAQTQLNLHSITDRVPGLVVIGRDDPAADRQVSRRQVSEQQGIEVHSWDWFLRQVRQASAAPTSDRVRIGDFPTPSPSLRPLVDIADEESATSEDLEDLL